MASRQVQLLSGVRCSRWMIFQCQQFRRLWGEDQGNIGECALFGPRDIPVWSRVRGCTRLDLEVE